MKILKTVLSLLAVFNPGEAQFSNEKFLNCVELDQAKLPSATLTRTKLPTWPRAEKVFMSKRANSECGETFFSGRENISIVEGEGEEKHVIVSHSKSDKPLYMAHQCSGDVKVRTWPPLGPVGNNDCILFCTTGGLTVFHRSARGASEAIENSADGIKCSDEDNNPRPEL